MIAIDLAASGFLRHMVRTIVGTLLLVGRAKLAVEDMAQILASRDRAQAGPTAPPHGLYLMSVTYPETWVNDRQARPMSGYLETH
jgi:tRNA pseudouridine38-40 synthase